MVNVMSLPSVVEALIEPLCASAIAFAMDRPIPFPPVTAERDSSGR